MIYEVMIMNAESLKELLDLAYEYGYKLISEWHERRMQQIRLTSANKKHLEDFRQELFEKRAQQRFDQKVFKA